MRRWLAAAGVLLVASDGSAAPRWVPDPAVEGSLADRARILALAVDPAVPARVYAASGNRLYQSVDGGRTLAALSPLPTHEAVRTLRATRLSSTPLAASPRLLVGTFNKGLFVSDDGGRTYRVAQFNATGGGPLPSTVWDIQVAQGSPQIAYLVEGALHRTRDGGDHWVRLDVPVPASGAHVAVGADGSTVYVAARDGLFKSVDSGESWRELGPGTGLPLPPYAYSVVPAVDAAQEDVVYVIVSTIGTYRSADGGGTWKAVGPAPLHTVDALDVDQGGRLWALALNNALYRSDDGGASWSQTPPGYVTPEAFARDRATRRVYLGSNSGSFDVPAMWHSDDGGASWTSHRDGLAGADTYAAFATAGRAQYVLGGGRLHRRLGDDGPWADITPPGTALWRSNWLGDMSSVLATSKGELIVSGQGRFRSADDGRTWQSDATNGANSLVHVAAIEPGAQDVLYGHTRVIGRVPGSNISVMLTATPLHRTIDGGGTWSRIDAGLPAITYALHAGGAGRLFAHTQDGGWFSGNAGDAWVRAASLPGKLLAVHARPDDPSSLLALTGDGVYRSSDAGASFVRVGPNPDPPVIVALAPDPVLADSTYAVGRNGEVYESADGGATWTMLAGSTGDYTTFDSAAVSPWSSAALYAATSRGVMKFVARADTAVATEFYHPPFDHFFVTTSAEEAMRLSAGELPPWRPTGRTFSVWETGSASRNPACRFFSASFAPKSSHFYTPYADECATLRQGGTWQYEGIAFDLQLPQGSEGARTCPAGTDPLYRAYNAMAAGAPNHRFTTVPAVLDAMLAQGWIMEGEAATRIFACVPAQR